jgi:P27 family predicted phage terminase small subunit
VRGRKPKPTHLRLIEGNAGHRPLNVDEPIPEGDLALPPAWFSPAQRLVWDGVIRDAPAGLLRRLDAGTVEVYCVAKELHSQAAQKISEFGAVVTVNGMPMRSPYVSIQNQQSAVLLKCAAELGFTPSSRTRVTVKAKKKVTAFGKLKTMVPD